MNSSICYSMQPEPSPSKRQKLTTTSDLRLPVPCPLLKNFSDDSVVNAIKKGEIKGLVKYRLLRDVASFYKGLCPNPTPTEFATMCRAVCNQFPSLKDKKPKDNIYWVCYHTLCRNCSTFSPICSCQSRNTLLRDTGIYVVLLSLPVAQVAKSISLFLRLMPQS